MGDPSERPPENVPGPWYVDSRCIDCDLSRQTAPDNFRRSHENGYSYIARQPVSPAEEALCRKAMDECPVGAIHVDG
ncbi:MAG: ferredoxin [Planctomycetes bacterium]|nr:ferredoxin [Planctomycetota bacterium]